MRIMLLMASFFIALYERVFALNLNFHILQMKFIVVKKSIDSRVAMYYNINDRSWEFLA